MIAKNYPLLRNAVLAVVALGSFGIMQSAHAVGTPANTAITNKATVNYSVSGTAQSPIESSPTGNTTSGLGNGTVTSFVVDNLVDFTVTELSTTFTSVTPGQVAAVTAFTVANTGNATQGFALTAANEVGTTVFGNVDNIQVTSPTVYVDSNGNDVYDVGVDTAANINSLAADGDVTVFIVATIPLTAANGDFANVSLTARAAVAGTNGGTLMTETAGPDTPGSVDVVFGDAGEDNSEVDSDQYAVTSAELTVTKTSEVIEDPINLLVNPKAIPGATVEYSIIVSNSSAVDATDVVISDPLPANTTFVTDGYDSGSNNVVITVGANPATYCFAEAGGVDTNTDGCVISGGQLVVESPAIGDVQIGAPGEVVIGFKVTIN